MTAIPCKAAQDRCSNGESHVHACVDGSRKMKSRTCWSCGIIAGRRLNLSAAGPPGESEQKQSTFSHGCRLSLVNSISLLHYEARRVSFFTIQLFSRYRFQEQNICASRGPLFGRGPREDLEISTAASPPNHVLSYSYQVNIETPLLHHVKFTLPAGHLKADSK